MKITKFSLLIALSSSLRPASALVGPGRGQKFVQRSQHEGTQLGAVTVVAESDRHFTITPVRVRTNPQTAWPLRLVTKVLRRENTVLSGDDEYSVASSHEQRSRSDTFIFDNFEDLNSSNDALADELIASGSTSKQTRLITIEEALGSEAPLLTPELTRSSAPLARVTASRAETILATLFHRWTQGAHTNLQVHCDSSSGVIDLVKGIFRADATIQFDKLSFGAFRLSRGELKSRRLAINLYKFAPFGKSIPRFASMFDLEAHDATFTQNDLFESTCIRRGLQKLLMRCLHNRGMSASNVEITGIEIVSTGKLSISGFATTPFGSKLDFAVRSGLGVSNRGHVLTFPGLEISLSPSMGLFMPVVPPLSLDMGHNAQITKLRLNGKDKTLELSCRVTITPRHTRKLSESYEQDTSAYAASFHFDVGRWLTCLGRFSE